MICLSRSVPEGIGKIRNTLKRHAERFQEVFMKSGRLVKICKGGRKDAVKKDFVFFCKTTITGAHACHPHGWSPPPAAKAAGATPSRPLCGLVKSWACIVSSRSIKERAANRCPAHPFSPAVRACMSRCAMHGFTSPPSYENRVGDKANRR
jgi:hypothetical protein